MAWVWSLRLGGPGLLMDRRRARGDKQLEAMAMLCCSSCNSRVPRCIRGRRHKSWFICKSQPPLVGFRSQSLMMRSRAVWGLAAVFLLLIISRTRHARCSHSLGSDALVSLELEPVHGIDVPGLWKYLVVKHHPVCDPHRLR
jgi:hypothetical protein